MSRLPPDETAHVRTLRALKGDRVFGGAWGLVVPLILAGAWAGWLSFGRVERIASAPGRVALVQSPAVIEAPFEGRVLESRVALGADVEAGAVLVVLDGGDLAHQLREVEARIKAINATLAALNEELATAETAVDDVERLGGAAEGERAAEQARLEAEHNLAVETEKRHRQLGSIVAPAELDRLVAKRDALAARLAQSRRGRRRVELERRRQASTLLAQVKALTTEVATKRGERAELNETAARLRRKLAEHEVRTPVAGQVTSLPNRPIGTFVDAGDTLAVVAAAGDLHVVGTFSAGSALGHVRSGQRGRLRLDAFSSVEYGAVPLEVIAVGAAVDGGPVRVELRIREPRPPRIPLQRGLVGTVEVEVETVSPAQLVARTVGRWLDGTPGARSERGAE